MPISPPNDSVDVGDWVAELKDFSAEAQRTAVQCRYVNGSNGFSWLVWKVPEGIVSIGHVIIYYPRGTRNVLAEDTFEGDVRFHYAVSESKISSSIYQHYKLCETCPARCQQKLRKAWKKWKWRMYYFRQLEHIGRLAKKLCRAMAEAIIRHYIDISASNVTSKKVVILASPPSDNEEMNALKV